MSILERFFPLAAPDSQNTIGLDSNSVATLQRTLVVLKDHRKNQGRKVNGAIKRNVQKPLKAEAREASGFAIASNAVGTGVILGKTWWARRSAAKELCKQEFPTVPTVIFQG